MQTVAFHTLGCKVNQYDTQAMLEAFQKAGYQVVPFEDKADVYVINTCTVTGTGDKKSMQLLRRIQRVNPKSEIVLAGCLAQRKGKELLETGARLIIGTQNRGHVVSYLEQAVAGNTQMVAVDSLEKISYESLAVTSHHGYTRAVMKIQEGCNRYCTYCIIPSVRGPVRSRNLDEIKKEALALAQTGFSEVVLTGIHIASYGLDLPSGESIVDVLGLFEEIEGITRVRLGSLEPNIVTDDFLKVLQSSQKICPQFHLALQSGSDTVLKRMGRRYSVESFLSSIEKLRSLFPLAAFTTDVLVGFPGESEEEFQQTYQTCARAGFSHMHVFPYSPREGTPAATFKDQVSKKVKDERVATLIDLNQKLSLAYRQDKLLNTIQPVLFEEEQNDTYIVGYTPQYIPVWLPPTNQVTLGKTYPICLEKTFKDGFIGKL